MEPEITAESNGDFEEIEECDFVLVEMPADTPAGTLSSLAGADIKVGIARCTLPSDGLTGLA